MSLVEAGSQLPNFYPAGWQHHPLSLAQIHKIVCQPNGFVSNAERKFMSDVSRKRNQQTTATTKNTLNLLIFKICKKSPRKAENSPYLDIHWSMLGTWWWANFTQRLCWGEWAQPRGFLWGLSSIILYALMKSAQKHISMFADCLWYILRVNHTFL